MSYAVLFTGQAGQHPDMLPWLESDPASAPVLALMSQRLGSDWRQQLQDPNRRHDNGFAQILITGTSMAAWAALQDKLLTRPTCMAGYSVGELPAFSSAGIFTAAQALQLAQDRATSMDQAVVGVKTGLLSVAGLSEVQVLELCPELGLECAIELSVQHAIYAGTDETLSLAQVKLIARGATCKRLCVRLASHSSWMTPAVQPFSQTLQGISFVNPCCPIGANALGSLSRDPDTLKQALSQQLNHRVQWSACMDAIAERRVDCVIEVGAGSALARLWNEAHPNIPARSMDDFRQAQGAVDWILKQSGR